MKYLAVSPHPDDVDFGCAGTMAKLCAEGHHVEELILTDGSKGNKPGINDTDELVQIREEEQKQAAEELGLADVTFLRMEDGNLTNTEDLRRHLVAEIRDKQPDVVFSFDPANRSFQNRYRAHRDHRQGALAVFDAVSPAAKNAEYFPELLERDLKPHAVKEFWFFATNNPNRIVNISEVMEMKIDALGCHRTQVPDREWVQDRLFDYGRGAASNKSFEFGEAFRILEL